eukprot:6118406-Amphidinium_carterae.2
MGEQIWTTHPDDYQTANTRPLRGKTGQVETALSRGGTLVFIELHAATEDCKSAAIWIAYHSLQRRSKHSFCCPFWTDAPPTLLRGHRAKKSLWSVQLLQMEHIKATSDDQTAQAEGACSQVLLVCSCGMSASHAFDPQRNTGKAPTVRRWHYGMAKYKNTHTSRASSSDLLLRRIQTQKIPAAICSVVYRHCMPAQLDATTTRYMLLETSCGLRLSALDRTA